MILTEPNEKTVDFGSETPLLESRITVWMHVIFGLNELAQMQLSLVRCKNFNFIIKVFLGSQLVQGATEILSHHETC